jgi:SAM-dependent methyltransferase
VSPAFQDHFSARASAYARFRPHYPAPLFDWLARVAPAHRLAWDCATGNGQAALGLAARFAHVVATDASAEQLRFAPAHPRIEWRPAPAERSGLGDAAVDLVTVAAAVHWFDLPEFLAEVARVTRPGGVLAVWTYHVGEMEPPFDALFRRLYWQIVKPCFAPETRLVDERYATLALPGDELAAPRFCMSAEWSCAQARDFIDSWSGSQAYLAAHGHEPSELVRDELAALWGDPDAVRTLRWPIHLRAVRLTAPAAGARRIE